MSGWTNYAESAVSKLIFLNTTIANIGDATGLEGSATAGSLWVMLLTADPTDAGTQTNECAYTSYARVAIARSGSGFTETNGVITNDADITFPEATGGSEIATHGAIVDASTSGNMWYHGSLTADIVISTGVEPVIAAGQLSITHA